MPPPSAADPAQDRLAGALEELRRRGHPVRSAAPMTGDVSRRAYHRVSLGEGPEGGGTAVLALYPPDLEETCRRYLRSGELLAGAGVRVPGVLERGCSAGWLLLEDLGERTLYEERARPWDELERLFADAVAAVRRIASLPRDPVAELNPPLDRELLARELAHTREHLFEPLGLADPAPALKPGPTSDLISDLASALDELCARLGAEEAVPCHRDFGARNLVPLETAPEPAVGVLDHQDLRLGPPAYDLASLLNDSLFPPPEVEERLLRLARAAGVDGATGGSTGPGDRASYHRAAAQRTLKAVGSYAAFARRGSSRHLPLIPPTLARALGHLRRLPETAPLAPRLEEHWGPVLEGRGLELLMGPA